MSTEQNRTDQQAQQEQKPEQSEQQKNDQVQDLGQPKAGEEAEQLKGGRLYSY
jgi:hypothetical protein